MLWNSTIGEDIGSTQAVGYILGTNKVTSPGGRAQYLAGQAIILEPGFEVEAGAVFEAKARNACQSQSSGFVELPTEIKR